MPTVKQPKKQDDVSIQDLYKAVLGLTKKLDKIVDSNTTGSNSLKYVQEQKANTEAINKLTKRFELFARDGKVTDVKNEKKALDAENKRLTVEKKKQDIRLKEEKAKQQKELFELKKKRELQLAKNDAEMHQREIKEKYSNRYKDTIAYKAGANIVGQKSNTGSAIALSMLTGGLVNPVVAKALGLDKLVTSTVKFAGRTIGNGMASIGSGAKKTAMGTLNAISGLGTGALDGLNQIRLGIGKTADERIKTRRLKMVEGIKSESDNAVAKDKAENNPVVKNQKTILTWLKGRFGDAPQEVAKEEEKKQSILGKLVDMFGGLGGIVKGLGFAALPMLIKHLWPDFVEKLNEKFTNFLTDKGLSESTTAGVSQLVKDALPGALFGLASGGFKGALIGAGLSMAGNYLKRKWDEFQGNAESETTPTTVGPFSADKIESVLAGATIGLVGGWKGAALGAAIGFGADTIFKTVNDWKKILTGEGEVNNTLGDYFSMGLTGALSALALPGTISGKKMLMGAALGIAIPWMTKQIDSLRKMFTGGEGGKADPSAIGWGEVMLKGAITGGIVASLIPGAGIKGLGIGIILGAVGGVILKTIAKIKEWWENFNVADTAKDIGDSALKTVLGDTIGGKASDMLGWSKSARESQKRQEKLDKATEKRLANEARLRNTIKHIGESDYISIFGKGDENNLTTSQRRILEEYRKGFSWKALGGQIDYETFDQTPIPENLGYTPMPKNLSYTPIPEQGAGGYGTVGMMSNSKNDMLHGRQVVGLKELSLSGSVVSSNSKPYIAEGNKESLQNLDKILNEWGYEVVYTSAMGGHRAGTGHWKGNKVDLQLKKNGRPAHLTPAQLNVLRKAGYWGPGTGALGWEPVSGQVGGGHYDLYVANGSSSGTVLASAGSLRLDTQNMPTAAENQYVAMNSMNETAMASAEANANSSGGILDMLGNIGNNISSGFDSMSSGSNNDGISVNGGAIGGGMPNIAMNIPNTNGGAGSSTGNVYAFGDVAKTPILYTL